MSRLRTISGWSSLPKEQVYADIKRYESGLCLPDVGDLIIELIGIFPDFDRAERLAVLAAERHDAGPAYLLAHNLFDTTGARASDEAWLKYVLLGIKSNRNVMYNFDIYKAIRDIENECGVWFPGHVDDLHYYVGLATHLNIVTNNAEVVRAYCRKKGDHYALKREEGPDTFPITTTFDESVLAKAYSLSG